MSEILELITTYARRRLPTNRREFRLVQGDGLFCIGWLARAVNLGLIEVGHARMTEAAIDRARTEVVPLSLSDQVGRFAPLTLQSPCLAYGRPDGSTIFIDGLKRAKQQFRAGHRDVEVAIVSLESAQKVGMSEDLRRTWKVLEATNYHPVGARRTRNFNRAIVQLHDDRDVSDRKAGRPRLSKEEDTLRQYLTYYLTALIEIEHYVCEKDPASAYIEGLDPKAGRERWSDAFLRAFYRKHSIPGDEAPANIANLAGEAIQKLTKMPSRAVLKRTAKSEWKNFSTTEITQDRDSTARICVALMKARIRSGLRHSSDRALVAVESDSRETPAYRQVHQHVEGHDEHERRRFELTSLGFADQLIVTHVTGVNLNDVYFDFTNIDPLFQAFKFVHDIGRENKADAEPCMVEALVHRRALDIVGERDGLTESWDGFFTSWAERGLNDEALMVVATSLDACRAVHAGEEVTFSAPRES